MTSPIGIRPQDRPRTWTRTLTAPPVRVEARATSMQYSASATIETDDGPMTIGVEVPVRAVARARDRVRRMIVDAHRAVHRSDAAALRRIEAVAGVDIIGGMDIVGDGETGLDWSAIQRQGAAVLGGAQGAAPASQLGALAGLLGGGGASAGQLAALAALLDSPGATGLGSLGGLSGLGTLLTGGESTATPQGLARALSALGALGGSGSQMGALAGLLGGATGRRGAGVDPAQALRNLLAGRGGNAANALGALSPLLTAAGAAVTAGADDSASDGLGAGLGILGALGTGAAMGGPLGLIAALPAAIAAGFSLTDFANLRPANRQTFRAGNYVAEPPTVPAYGIPSAIYGPSKEEFEAWAATDFGQTFRKEQRDLYDRGRSGYLDAHGLPDYQRAADVPQSVRDLWYRSIAERKPWRDLVSGSDVDIIGAEGAAWPGVCSLWQGYCVGPHDTARDAAELARRVGSVELAARLRELAPSADVIAAGDICDAIAGTAMGEDASMRRLAAAIAGREELAGAWELARALGGGAPCRCEA